MHGRGSGEVYVRGPFFWGSGLEPSVEKQLLGHLGNIKQFFWVSLVYITIIIYDYMIVSNHGQKLGLAPSGLGMGIVAMWVV